MCLIQKTFTKFVIFVYNDYRAIRLVLKKTRGEIPASLFWPSLARTRSWRTGFFMPEFCNRFIDWSVMKPLIFRDFDFIEIYLIHRNNFFRLINKPNSLWKHVKRNKGIPWLYKARPAIILKSFAHKSGKPNRNLYWVIPLTSQSSFTKWNDMWTVRPQLTHKDFGKRKSYLMVDRMQSLDRNQIKGFYLVNKKKITFSNAQKKYIRAIVSESFKTA